MLFLISLSGHCGPCASILAVAELTRVARTYRDFKFKLGPDFDFSIPLCTCALADDSLAVSLSRQLCNRLLSWVHASARADQKDFSA